MTVEVSLHLKNVCWVLGSCLQWWDIGFVFHPVLFKILISDVDEMYQIDDVELEVLPNAFDGGGEA